MNTQLNLRQSCFDRAKPADRKKPEKVRFFLAFFISNKSQRHSKNARISKSSFKHAKLATLVDSSL